LTAANLDASTGTYLERAGPGLARDAGGKYTQPIGELAAK
jgi:hypothetical protein